MKALTALFIFTIVLMFSEKTIYAQDAAEVAPNIFKVLLDNDEVRVLEVTVKPGESTGMHSHPSYVLYFLTDGKMQTTLSDGKATESDVKVGDTRWSEAVTHNNKNVGKSELKAIVVELKNE